MSITVKKKFFLKDEFESDGLFPKQATVNISFFTVSCIESCTEMESALYIMFHVAHTSLSLTLCEPLHAEHSPMFRTMFKL